MAETFDARWQQVTCVQCGTTYQCTPQDDYYNATNDHDGLCLTCLVLPSTPTPSPAGSVVP
jgi:hypothetical protein